MMSVWHYRHVYKQTLATVGEVASVSAPANQIGLQSHQLSNYAML